MQSVIVERGLESTQLATNHISPQPASASVMFHLETIVFAVLGVLLLLMAILYVTLVAMRMRNLQKLRELKLSNAQHSWSGRSWPVDQRCAIRAIIYRPIGEMMASLFSAQSLYYSGMFNGRLTRWCLRSVHLAWTLAFLFYLRFSKAFWFFFVPFNRTGFLEFSPSKKQDIHKNCLSCKGILGRAKWTH